MQGSSCYCDALSHSRSGRTPSALPAARSQPAPNIHMTHTHARTHCKGSGSPRLKAAGEIRGDGVCVCEMGGVCAGDLSFPVCIPLRSYKVM